ncbi:unnamed protein product [Rhodiola kirilowii]
MLLTSALAKFLDEAGASECMSSHCWLLRLHCPRVCIHIASGREERRLQFGVVLLELITGRKPVGEGEFGEGVDIVQWSKKMTRGRKEDAQLIVDREVDWGAGRRGVCICSSLLCCVCKITALNDLLCERCVQMLSEYSRSFEREFSFFVNIKKSNYSS